MKQFDLIETQYQKNWLKFNNKNHNITIDTEE